MLSPTLVPTVPEELELWAYAVPAMAKPAASTAIVRKFRMETSFGLNVMSDQHSIASMDAPSRVAPQITKAERRDFFRPDVMVRPI
jgi:hypothetical protein